MNHRPFEDWLLNDQPLTPTEKRDLDAHIRTCKYCAALAETGLGLRSVRMVSAKPGFTSRFQKCLAAQRIADRRRLYGPKKKQKSKITNWIEWLHVRSKL